jgi:outer membrane protein assembly factor BamB
MNPFLTKSFPATVNGDNVIAFTDAKNYVSSGTLYCYDKNGIRKWGVRTGDIPAHMVFLYK